MINNNKGLPVLMLALMSYKCFAQQCLPIEQRYDLSELSSAKDTITNLTWTRCLIGQTFENNTCEGEATLFNWEEAIIFSNTFHLNGHSDWRLPNVKELHSTETVYCPPTTEKLNLWSSQKNWSSTPYVNDDNIAWAGNQLASKQELFTIRLVRSY